MPPTIEPQRLCNTSIEGCGKSAAVNSRPARKTVSNKQTKQQKETKYYLQLSKPCETEPALHGYTVTEEATQRDKELEWL